MRNRNADIQRKTNKYVEIDTTKTYATYKNGEILPLCLERDRMPK